ncbi:hypothetical protein DY000_02040882 [Brassica cretica]|uniref:Uncharacterized protein n=1 Tax=Brassica cretica TaxID=69181 RepID=A0ABQ7B6Z8_BRACR|nr:hypothetical protein DY000_02040882 [Brassica cretica]
MGFFRFPARSLACGDPWRLSFPNNCTASSVRVYLASSVTVRLCWLLLRRPFVSCFWRSQFLKSSPSGTPISTGFCLSKSLWLLFLL